MKIAVNITVEMTPEQVRRWANEYGLDNTDKTEIRSDVKAYIESIVQQCSAIDDDFFTVK